ncbi:hypothetical protein [Formosa algae]|uniref:Transporter n=1 Tax=Formosa algae TaxID=225843 RepID=A0A9X0YHW4_9FLAO|nr:hypothetical protein [Formosa algae]MBP1838616.1 hypothetical protein [Formosa algae]MDQ0335116.1 hypothetical protein [Formosa algae]OEI80469.1 hypothetical protein AST99_09095 [Formosa algae]
MKNFYILIICLISLTVSGQTDADALAKQLQNPIANLISLPVQANFDYGIGTENGSRMTLNIQPVIPFSVSENWNLVTRTIVPVISQNNVFGKSGSQFGLGDVVATAFLSPKAPTDGGIVWGVGPVLLLPTSTDNLLGLGEFGAGPSAVALTQKGAFTVGGLVNHIWANQLSSTFFNPFIGRNFSGGRALTLNTELTQNWTNDAFTGVVMLQGSKVFKVGNQAINAAIAPRYHFGGAKAADWGVRALLIFLFPK